MMSFVLSVTIVQGSILEASIGTTNDMTPLNARIVDNYGKLPVRFEQNEGQTLPSYNYVARGQGYTMFLKSDGIVMALIPSMEKTTNNKRNHQNTNPAKKHKVDVVSIKFAGNVKLPELTALDALEGKSNYLIGSSEEKWLSNVTAYRRIKYTGLYPGIDLVLYGNQQEIEYDFVVQPMADLKKIALKINGTISVKINNSGDIVMRTHGGEMLMRKPRIYQEIDGGKKPVNGTYVIKNNHTKTITISFKVDDYNKRLPLVIDPVLQYSTYLGGSSGDQALAIAVDTLGYAYVTGKTISLDFPIVNQYHNSYNGDYYDAFVSKFSRDGSSLIYSTYIGGNRDDEAKGITVDTNANTYITGSTYSQDFPIVNPFQTSLHGWVDAFVAKLSSDGTSLMYSTYFGGSGNDEANAIAVDSGGNAYITGYTYSTDLPVNNAYQSDIAGYNDAFVTKFSTSGTYIPYSTYLGGTAEDEATSIAVDSNGSAYITGFTSSTNFPTTSGPFQAVHGGGTYDAFVTKLSATGSPLFSTYVGGNGSDRAKGIAVDTNSNVYITGSTASTNFPVTATATQGALKGMTDAFVTKLASSGLTLSYSTYLGGSNIDAANAIAADKNGNISVTGETASTDFPTLNPYQKTNGGFYDAFMARFTITTDSYNLHFSTCLGGSADDKATAITVDQSGDAYLCGHTASTNFPVTRSMQPNFTPPVKDTDLAIDAFVAKIRFKLYRSDFNADGNSDILWQNTATGQLYVWLINGTDFYSGDTPATVSDPNWQYRGKGDFNADRMTDVLWQNTATGQLIIWFMDGAKIQSVGNLATLGDQSWQIKGFADFDGDGNTDILWQNSVSGEVGIWFIDGTSIVRTASLGTVSSQWQIKASEDFNGNDKADVLWQNTATGQLAIWSMDGAKISSIGNLATVAGSAWQIRTTADFNADGRSDILWQDSTSGQLYIWLIDGATIIGGGPPAVMTDPNWQLKAVNDFNNDNKADMLWFNTSTGEVYIWLMDGAYISSGGSPATVGANSSWQIK
ncbi:MAG: SBBP repeat-containing protein [Nitrospirae bacterium]|nr:SBBP repeat-containing protein [Nitrospirota bacterium]